MSVRVRIEGLDKMAEDVKRQLPFAGSRAITWTARDARTALVEQLPQTFVVRNTWVARGLRTTRADKGQWPRSEAQVGSIQAYMAWHAQGGTKGGRRGTAVPIRARANKRAKLRPAQFPSKVLGRAVSAGDSASQLSGHGHDKWFARLLPSGDVGVFQRKGPKRAKVEQLWWIIKRQVEIPKRWRFLQQVEESVAKTWGKNFAKSMDLALKPKAPRAG